MTLLLATILLLGAPVAAPTGQEGPAADPATAPAAGKKICRSEAVTGSLFAGKRICHTKSEWAQLDAAAHRGTDDFRNKVRPTN